MSRIVVIGGTGYAGAAIVAEAAARGHQVTSLSRKLPAERIASVEYVQGDAADEATLKSVIAGKDAVIEALAPRGEFAKSFRDVYRKIAHLADAAKARLFVVGGFSSLRPAAGAPRYVEDLSHVPAELHEEIRAGAALVLEDLPATPPSLDWVFVSPAMKFGAFAPGSKTGKYRQGTDVAVDPKGGAISSQDYAAGMVDLIEKGGHARGHVNLGY